MSFPLSKETVESIKQSIRKYKMNIDDTLKERGARYGQFDEHARIAQNIKQALKDSPNWDQLADDQKECLEMLAHKTGRILNGDPDFHDSWHDIVGYAKLVADRLLKKSQSQTVHVTVGGGSGAMPDNGGGSGTSNKTNKFRTTDKFSSPIQDANLHSSGTKEIGENLTDRILKEIRYYGNPCNTNPVEMVDKVIEIVRYSMEEKIGFPPGLSEQG